jgi:phosphopantothenate-cysteine ligase/phosphopantothenoylcysteine decarboxylase/phosphopantothenate--cysteine ligase
MRILVTAGNTQAPIDRVRCITNIFTGRTGASIALEAYRRGHQVMLITSHPETIDAFDPDPGRWSCRAYRTFAELEAILAEQVRGGSFDAIVQSAAISDYLVAGVYARKGDEWLDRAVDKVRSDEPELWLRLTRAPKLVDKIRSDWGYRGLLVKFKLQVGVSESELLNIAEKSRQHSAADWMVANTLEGAGEWALLGNEQGYRKVTRSELPVALLDSLESRHV